MFRAQSAREGVVTVHKRKVLQRFPEVRLKHGVRKKAGEGIVLATGYVSPPRVVPSQQALFRQLKGWVTPSSRTGIESLRSPRYREQTKNQKVQTITIAKTVCYCAAPKRNQGYNRNNKEIVLRAPNDPKYLALWHRAMQNTYLKFSSTDRISVEYFTRNSPRQGSKGADQLR